MEDKIRINIEAAAAKHRHELPVTYRPSVRDVCESSYKAAANEWYALGHSVGNYVGQNVGMKNGYNQALNEAISAIGELIAPTHTYSSDEAHAANGALHQAIRELEKLRKQ